MSFAEWYAIYPKKESRKDAEKAWGQIGTANQQKALLALPNHVQMWLSRGTEIQFLPHPASWLRGYRWEDEIVIAKPKVQPVQIAWWASESGILAEGVKRGIAPRPGESMEAFKGRVNATQARAA